MEKSKFDRIMSLVLVLLCVILLIATIVKMYSPKEEMALATGDSATVINVNAEAAFIGEYSSSSFFQGEAFSPESNVELFADTSGKITKILVERGDNVEKGDIVAYVDASRPGSSYEESPVRATISGEVLSVDVSVGMDVTTSTSIATLIGDKELRVKTQIPEKYLSSITYGLDGYVTSEAYSGKTFPVEITYISPIVKQSNRTVEVELTFTGDKEGIREGMFVSISLITERQNDVLLINSDAVSRYAGDTIVYVANNGTAERRVVTTLSDNGNYAIVESGLNEGDLVITSGNVSDGSQISIVQESGNDD